MARPASGSGPPAAQCRPDRIGVQRQPHRAAVVATGFGQRQRKGGGLGETRPRVQRQRRHVQMNAGQRLLQLGQVQDHRPPPGRPVPQGQVQGGGSSCKGLQHERIGPSRVGMGLMHPDVPAGYRVAGTTDERSPARQAGGRRQPCRTLAGIQSPDRDAVPRRADQLLDRGTLQHAGRKPLPFALTGPAGAGDKGRVHQGCRLRPVDAHQPLARTGPAALSRDTTSRGWRMPSRTLAPRAAADQH